MTIFEQRLADIEAYMGEDIGWSRLPRLQRWRGYPERFRTVYSVGEAIRVRKILEPTP